MAEGKNGPNGQAEEGAQPAPVVQLMISYNFETGGIEVASNTDDDLLMLGMMERAKATMLTKAIRRSLGISDAGIHLPHGPKILT